MSNITVKGVHYFDASFDFQDDKIKTRNWSWDIISRQCPIGAECRSGGWKRFCRGQPADWKSEKDFASRFETLFRFATQHWMKKTFVYNRIIGKRRDIYAMKRANDRARWGINHSIAWHDIHISLFSSNKTKSVIFISFNTIVLRQIFVRIQQKRVSVIKPDLIRAMFSEHHLRLCPNKNNLFYTKNGTNNEFMIF
jgi:hypothetical protein